MNLNWCCNSMTATDGQVSSSSYSLLDSVSRADLWRYAAQSPLRATTAKTDPQAQVPYKKARTKTLGATCSKFRNNSSSSLVTPSTFISLQFTSYCSDSKEKLYWCLYFILALVMSLYLKVHLFVSSSNDKIALARTYCWCWHIYRLRVSKWNGNKRWNSRFQTELLRNFGLLRFPKLLFTVFLA